MAPEVEALLVAMRRECPVCGPQTLLFSSQARRVEPLPSRSAGYQCLVRHGLITPRGRRRRRSDYKRWERVRAMELWQMDIVGGVRLADGSKASIVSGIGDHSRFWSRLVSWLGRKPGRWLMRWLERCELTGSGSGGLDGFSRERWDGDEQPRRHDAGELETSVLLHRFHEVVRGSYIDAIGSDPREGQGALASLVASSTSHLAMLTS